MKSKIKQIIKQVIRSCITLLNKTTIGTYIYNEIINLTMEQVKTINHNKIDLRFDVPNKLSRWRVETFSSKEPETLEWIDNLQKNSVLWDIGANIGLYSVYAALKKNCNVLAFEPSVFNLELLARNIYLNGVTKKICIVPIALNDKIGPSHMHMTTTEWGGALSTFGQDFGWDGNKIRQVFEFQTMGVTMEDAIVKLALPQPDYIKMDVDGLEHFILKGGRAVLKKVKGILIEVNDDFNEQAEQCSKLLKKAGLNLKEKKHSDMIGDSTTGFQNTYNQIWVRS